MALELVSTPLADRVRAIAAKRSDLALAEHQAAQAKDRVKTLRTEYHAMLDALVDQSHGIQPLPLAPLHAREPDAEDADGEAEDAPLTGAERRALALTDEDVRPDHAQTRAPETQPLSSQQPGLYVTEDEGPEA